MLSRLASLAFNRRRLVLVLSVVALALLTAIAAPVTKSLSPGGFDDPHSQSSAADAALRDQFHTGDPNFILLATPPGSVDDPQAVSAGKELTRKLAAEKGVASVTSYWSDERPKALRAQDGKSALITAWLTGGDDTAAETAKRIVPDLTGTQGILHVRSGGLLEANRQASATLEKDLDTSEGIVVPITLILLILVFGSGMAALLPLAVAGVSIMGSLALLEVIAQFTPVSIFATDLTTALGLGLAIDYSLFIVSRYREERAAGHENSAALRIAMVTSGRTVLFSSMTVLLSLCSLLVFRLYYLRSFAYAGMGVVIFALLGALVVLPMLLALLGDRIDKFSLSRRFRRRAGDSAAPVEHTFWHRLASGVMRRPWPVLIVVVAALAVLVAPFFHGSYGLPDDRAMSKKADAAVVGQTIRTQYPSLAGQDLSVVLQGRTPSTQDLGAYAQKLSKVTGIDAVNTSTGTYQDGRRVADGTPAGQQEFTGKDGAWLALSTRTEAYSSQGRTMVSDVRAVTPPPGTDRKVTGLAAQFSDTLHSLYGSLPWAIGIIAVLTFVLLFLFTGSLVMPIQAMVLNLLSLTPTFGAMVFIFQDGHLKWLVGDFTVTGQTDVTTPILMFCIIFGLSMDYEVFLLSRIREEYDRTRDNTDAVAVGLGSTGRLISAAAGLMALFFLALVGASFVPVKILGLGTALAILMDALVIRGLLAPALMRIIGDTNWWAPGPLRRVYRKVGLHHGEEPAAPTPGGPVPVGPNAG
ncbi:MMPL family transporter [Streptomyces caeni]|uniref:MMPL family transporter n=1 Tax=Streptomyces caeni TaxID=2307231 RepID=A0ABW4IW07_9ACTN